MIVYICIYCGAAGVNGGFWPRGRRNGRYGQASFVDMAEAMLQKHGPIKPAELVVAIRETGYRAGADPHATMAAVRQLLRR